MMDLGLSEEELEEAQATKFARLLVKELRQRRHDTNRRLIEAAAGGEDYPAKIHSFAGRVAAYEDVLRLIGVVDGL